MRSHSSCPWCRGWARPSVPSPSPTPTSGSSVSPPCQKVRSLLCPHGSCSCCCFDAVRGLPDPRVGGCQGGEGVSEALAYVGEHKPSSPMAWAAARSPPIPAAPMTDPSLGVGYLGEPPESPRQSSFTPRRRDPCSHHASREVPDRGPVLKEPLLWHFKARTC